jgi:hypothetical protein
MKNNSKTTLIALTLLTALFSACCSYDQKDFDFTSEELAFASSFHVGDTIYYESNLHDIDTLLILDTLTEQTKGCGWFIAPRPSNIKSIVIKHLPIDIWHGTTTTSENGKAETKINYQTILSVCKYPVDKKLEFVIDFKNFNSIRNSSLGEFHSDTILLNGKTFSNYFLVKHSYPERVKNSTDIEYLYWTVQDGLVAYQNKSGELWTLKKSYGK